MQINRRHVEDGCWKMAIEGLHDIWQDLSYELCTITLGPEDHAILAREVAKALATADAMVERANDDYASALRQYETTRARLQREYDEALDASRKGSVMRRFFTPGPAVPDHPREPDKRRIIHAKQTRDRLRDLADLLAKTEPDLFFLEEQVKGGPENSLLFRLRAGRAILGEGH